MNEQDKEITLKYYWKINNKKMFAPIPEITVSEEVMNEATKIFMGEE